MQTRPLYRDDYKPATNIAAIESMDELKALIDKLYNSKKPIGFDLESGFSGPPAPRRSLNMYHPLQFIVSFSITDDPSWARYVPLRHDFANNLDPNEVWPLMKPLLEERMVVAHNFSFESENLLRLDAKGDGPNIDLFKGGAHDSMIQAYVLSDVPPLPLDGALKDGEYIQRYIPPFFQTPDGFQDLTKPKTFGVGLKSLTKFRYNYDQNDIYSLFNGGKELTKKQRDCIRFNPLPVTPEVVRYASDDAYLCLQLFYDQMERISEDPYLPGVYDLEMQIVQILVEMRATGISVDWDGLDQHAQISKDFEHEMKVNARRMFEKETGRDLSTLNFNSAVQMRKLLYDPKEEGGLGLTTERTTDKGLLSTDEKALTPLISRSPAVDALLKYRQCIKQGQWFDQITALKDQYEDNKLHPNYLQTTIASGRFSCTDPNVQQLTKRWWFQSEEGTVPELMRKGKQGKEYWTGSARDFIVASEGYIILSFDYKSAEVQMLAALAQEEAIIQAFFDDQDFHRWSASLMFNKNIEDVTKMERQSAKSFTFGSVFRQSVAALSQQLGISRQEGETLQQKYFAAFTHLKEFFDQQDELVASENEVRTFLGRKATIWESMHANKAMRAKGQRQGTNIPVQGGATGDYTKMAMVRSRNALKKKGWWNDEVRLLMNQHDSLVFEVREDLDLQEVVDVLTGAVQFSLQGVKEMYNEFPKFPPMSVDWEVGYRWGSIVDFGKEKDFKAEAIEITMGKGVKPADMASVSDTLVVTPGPMPYTIHFPGTDTVRTGTVARDPNLPSRLKKGDPDLGIMHAPGDKVSAEFVFPA